MVEQKREISTQRTGSGSISTEKTTMEAAPSEKAEKVEEEKVFKISYAVYYFLGFIEALLILRTIFKLLGANPDTGFVSFIYSLTGMLIAPFEAIFSTATGTGDKTTAIFEPAAIIAMFVYALVAWGIASLINILVVKKEE